MNVHMCIARRKLARGAFFAVLTAAVQTLLLLSSGSVLLLGDTIHTWSDVAVIIVMLNLVIRLCANPRSSQGSVFLYINILALWFGAIYLGYEIYDRSLNPDHASWTLMLLGGGFGGAGNLVTLAYLERVRFPKGLSVLERNHRGILAHMRQDFLTSAVVMVGGVCVLFRLPQVDLIGGALIVPYFLWEGFHILYEARTGKHIHFLDLFRGNDHDHHY